VSLRPRATGQFLNAALKYAAVLKWPVFPLRERSKVPATPHGFQDATRDEAKIRRWWSDLPCANIGTPTGLSFWALDEDPRHGGDATLETLVADNRPLPNTVQQITGGDGRHYLWEMPDQQTIGCTKLGPGLDVKGLGGYIVIAPSVHPDSGKTYIWDGADPLAKQRILPAPTWLLGLISTGKSQYEKKAAADEEGQWPEGERNTRLASLAGKLRYTGLEVETITAALLAENRRRCAPPLDETEVRKIAASISRYPPGDSASAPGSFSAQFDLADLPQTIQTLNALPMFKGRIEFASIKGRGPMLVATFADGSEAIWPSTADLISFSRSQAILAEATRIMLPTPPRYRVKKIWEPAVQLLLSIASADRVTTQDKLRDEFGDYLKTAWTRAGCHVATTDEEFLKLLHLCREHARDPHGPPPPCCVWHDNRSCYVHQPSLIEWLSVPTVRNKQFDWGELRNAMLLLEFRPERVHRSVTTSAGPEAANVRLWRGPLEQLVDDET
jgi:hypothetical protein